MILLPCLPFFHPFCKKWQGVPKKWQGVPEKWQGVPLFQASRQKYAESHHIESKQLLNIAVMLKKV